jgi:hypothetical protein
MSSVSVYSTPPPCAAARRLRRDTGGAGAGAGAGAASACAAACTHAVTPSPSTAEISPLAKPACRRGSNRAGRVTRILAVSAAAAGGTAAPSSSSQPLSFCLPRPSFALPLLPLDLPPFFLAAAASAGAQLEAGRRGETVWARGG